MIRVPRVRNGPEVPSCVGPGRAAFARVVAFALVACVSSLAACSDAEPGGGTVADLPLASVEREVRIGALDDPLYAFTPVTSVVVAPDETIWTLHRQESVLRRWSADGEPLGSIGRQGEGPGEFTQVSAMGTLGDSLWVHDMGLQRFTHFGWDGSVLGTLPAPIDMGTPEGAALGQHPVRASGLLADGSIHASTPGFSHDIAEGRLTRIAHVRQDSNAVPLDTVAQVPVGPSSTLALIRETGGTFTSQPFGDAMAAHRTPDGTALVLVDRTAAAASGLAMFRVIRVATVASDNGHAPGDTVRITEVPYEARPIPAAEVARHVDRITDQLWSFMGERLGIPRAQFRRDVEDAIYVPATRPPAGRVVAGRDGSTWIELLQAPPEAAEVPEAGPGAEAGATAPPVPTRWLVLAPDGEMVHRVDVPPRVRVLAATVDRIWGTETDELEVEYVVRYRVVADVR